MVFTFLSGCNFKWLCKYLHNILILPLDPQSYLPPDLEEKSAELYFKLLGYSGWWLKENLF